MSNDQPSRRPPAKSSGGGAPMGSTISIVVAVIAVIVGFLILRNINDDDDNASGTTPSTEATVDTSQSSTTTTLEPPPSTTTPIVTTGANVVVANASGIGGAAGRYTTSLEAVGFTMGTATNATAPDQRLEASKVYYKAGGEEVAASVAQVMSTPGGTPIATAPMPTPAPIEGGDATLGDATVLVMLGKDQADKPLPALAAETPETSTSLPSSPINDTTTTTG